MKMNLEGCLRKHYKSIHEDVIFKCSECEYKARKKTILNVHIKVIHDGIKEFECLYCGATFGQKIHMKTHVKRMHKDVSKEMAKIDEIMDHKAQKRNENSSR